ncbi:MAG: hypothetical protein GPJ52_00695 [Candidatus Heimdallarchaeota archaeon]|nr:hypothetical protein [Candidatus Heimdallarchaeota archaeon]
MNTTNSAKQYIRCVKDSGHILTDRFFQVTGLTTDDFQQANSSLGIPILPGYEIQIVDDILFVGQLMLRIRDLRFIYDYVGIQPEIKQMLIDSGCFYKRIESQQGWFNLKRMPVRKAACVDAIRLCNGFNNLYFNSIIKSDLSLIYTLQGMSSRKSAIQPIIDRVSDAYLLGYHCHESTLCNATEGLAAKVIWEFTDKLIKPFGFRIRHRVSNRLYNKKRMVGNYRAIARTKADALFNTTFQIFEEELWILLEELGLNYLGVGGFSHFSINSDLVWMGLPLDLCDSLKKAGHSQLIREILDEEISVKHIETIVGFKGERLYYVSPVGREILSEAKEKVFCNSCVFNGQAFSSFKEALKKNVLEFDNLLNNICERLHEEQLFLNDKETINAIAMKLWRFIFEWEWLPESQKDLLRENVFTICQEEITKSGFHPIVWMKSNYAEQLVMNDLAELKKLSFLYRERERNYLLKNAHKISQLSPRVKEYSFEMKELPIKWINLE